MTATGFSKQQAFGAGTNAIRRIIFTGNLDGTGNTKMFFILEEVKEAILNFLQGAVRVVQMKFLKCTS